MKTDILNRMESLTLVMWEAAEAGNLDTLNYVPLFEMMEKMIVELRALEEVSA